MARETALSRMRREQGPNWTEKASIDCITKQADKILTDLSFGNIVSEDDMADFKSYAVMYSLGIFCLNRYHNLYYILNCIEAVRRGNAAFTATGADNSLYYIIYSNIENSCNLYASIVNIIHNYIATQDPTCIVKLFTLFDEKHRGNRNLINPSKFI